MTQAVPAKSTTSRSAEFELATELQNTCSRTSGRLARRRSREVRDLTGLAIAVKPRRHGGATFSESTDGGLAFRVPESETTRAQDLLTGGSARRSPECRSLNVAVQGCVARLPHKKSDGSPSPRIPKVARPTPTKTKFLLGSRLTLSRNDKAICVNPRTRQAARVGSGSGEDLELGRLQL